MAEHRRTQRDVAPGTHRTFARSAWLLPVAALLAACAGTAPESPEGAAPPSVVDADTAPPRPGDPAPPAATGPDAPTADAGADAAPAGPPSPPPVAAPQFGPEGDYFPGPLSVVHFVGLQFLSGTRTAPIRIVQTSRAKAGDRVPFEQSMRVGEESLEETFVAEVTSGGLRVGLASGRLRVVPPPVLEMPRKPRIGQTWSVDLGGHSALCLIEALDTARTFVGDVADCVRIRIEHPGGAVHRRWYHPEKGLVRAEARGPDGRLLSGWALAGETEPPAEAFERLFRRDG